MWFKRDIYTYPIALPFSCIYTIAYSLVPINRGLWIIKISSDRKIYRITANFLLAMYYAIAQVGFSQESLPYRTCTPMHREYFSAKRIQKNHIVKLCRYSIGPTL
jgi:hypothetical protein